MADRAQFPCISPWPLVIALPGRRLWALELDMLGHGHGADVPKR